MKKFNLCGYILLVVLFHSIIFAGQVEKEFCEGQWPGDYRMQEYCYKKQLTAKAKFQILYMKYWPNDSNNKPIKPEKIKYKDIPEEIKICLRCKKEWKQPSGHIDWSMVHYCANKQLAAYERMKRE